MTKRDWWVAAASALAVSTALAQAAKPKDDATAEAAAGMERARKQAANPMRIILEASKGKRRAGEDAAPPAPAAEASVRPVVNRTAPAATVAAAAPAEVVVARAAAAPASAAAQPSPPADPAPVVVQVTLNSELAQAKAADSVPALAPTGGASVAAPAFNSLPVAAPSLEVAQAKPRLLSMVEPDVPQRLLDDLGRNATVAVDMTIRPDGTVSNVVLASAAPRALQRVLVSAIEQWRFAPMAAARAHRVELIFNSDR